MYFIAVLTSDEINQQVLAYKNYMLEKFGCKVALRSPAHVTLIPPFNMANEREDELLKALSFFWSEQQEFSVQLKDFNAFKPRVIFIDVLLNEQLAMVKRRLEHFLYQLAFPIIKETRPFHPHVTIANRDLSKYDFPKAWEHFQHLNYENEFVVKGISLLRSEAAGWKVVKGER